jgi:prephenate dehydrogenase
MKLTVVGLGLIGGSAALDLKARGFATRVTGVDSSPEHGRQALERGLVDEVKPLEEALADSALVIISVPVSGISRVLHHALALGQATVTDMGSTKSSICEAVASHPGRSRYVASHPMAGTEHSGPKAAIAGLFEGKAAVICDGEQSDPESLALVEEMYRALKMRLVRMGSTEHDLHAAYVSHLSHISSFVLANTVLDKEKDVDTIFDLASGGFESTVRLAKSSPDMWTPIFEQNRGSVVEALEAYIGHLTRFRDSLANGKLDETRRLMENANRIRGVLARIAPRAVDRRNSR